MSKRDYDLAIRLSKAPDDLVVGPEEVAAVAGLSPTTVRQRRNKSFPQPLSGIKALRWRLGDVRAWMRGSTAAPKRQGRPTKAETLAAAAAAIHPADSA